jgi:isoquinoline 1-oxidoreductase beta subunit
MASIGKITRRAVLATAGLAGGGLVLGVALAPNRLKMSEGLDVDEGEVVLNTWLKIDTDNTVTVIVPHSEMGQGIHTALPMMLADELDADWSLVKMEQAPAIDMYANNELARGYILGHTSFPKVLVRAVDYGFFKVADMMHLQVTGGSSSVRFTGEIGMRRAGATAKEMLVKAAAARWGVAETDCDAKMSVVTHAASGKSATYGELAADAAAFEPNVKPTLKTPGQFTIMGTPMKRFDIPSKVDGSAKYGIDVQVPGMVYAAFRQAPVFGGKLESVDASAIKGKRGIIQTVELEDAVAVVADSYWRAKTALDQIDIKFSDGGNGNVTSESIFAEYETVLDANEGESDVAVGDAAATLSEADDVFEATYQVPFLAHATMEPLNCTAFVKDGKCELWAGHQGPLEARYFAAAALGISADNVTMNNFQLGGGFGRRYNEEFIQYAALVAREVGKPVKLVWSREDDIQHDRYRPAVSNRFKAVLDDKGLPTVWSNQYIDVGQNEPADAPHIQYGIPNQDIRRVSHQIGIPLGAWRSVGHTQHSFFNESFVDELAHKAGRDPYEYRRELLADAPRHRKVLDMAAKKAGWGEPLPEGHVHGIALEQSFDSIVAEVVELSIDEYGEAQVHKVTAAVDAGFAVNPDTLEAQIQGGIIYGLTATLFGEITIEGGAVAQSNFPDYEMVRLDTAPRTEVHIINSGEALGGAGEPGTPPIGAAVANAVFAATGKRLRSLPVKNHDLTPGPEGQKISAL